MTDSDEAIETFLEKAATVYGEYDQGYADADATLRQLKRHIEDLREAHDDE